MSESRHRHHVHRRLGEGVILQMSLRPRLATWSLIFHGPVQHIHGRAWTSRAHQDESLPGSDGMACSYSTVPEKLHPCLSFCQQG